MFARQCSNGPKRSGGQVATGQNFCWLWCLEVERSDDVPKKWRSDGRWGDKPPGTPSIRTLLCLLRSRRMTRLDYCNGLLGGALKYLLGPLSGVLWAAAHLILLLPRSGSVTDRIHTKLHWLDIPSRVTFKLCALAYRCIHESAPSYLARFFTPVSAIAGCSQLRSAMTSVLFVPRSHTSTIGPRAFAISAPSSWNSLPVDLRDPGLCLLTFRKILKT